MFYMIVFFLFLFLSGLMLLMNMLLSKFEIIDREKPTPFECGFDPFKSSRISISLHFYMVCIMFLIFDVEISLLLPLIPSINCCSLIYLSLTFLIILVILFLGILYELFDNSVLWLI